MLSIDQMTGAAHELERRAAEDRRMTDSAGQDPDRDAPNAVAYSATAERWRMTAEICARLDLLIAIRAGDVEVTGESPIDALRRGARPKTDGPSTE